MKHICPKCGNGWNCMNPDDCDMGVGLSCPICNAEENDYNPDTHIKYPGAFKEWKEKNV